METFKFKSKIPKKNLNGSGTSKRNTTNPIDNNANVAHCGQFNKNEHAIIIKANDEISVEESIEAITTFVCLSDIKHASRISKNEVRIYLPNKKRVESLLKAINKINTRRHSLFTEPLVQEAKRIILSDIWPAIPNQVILDQLRYMNIIPILPIARVPLAKPELISNISDLNRQVYIQPEDIEKLSDHIEIDYDNKMHYINIQYDNSTILIIDKNELQGSYETGTNYRNELLEVTFDRNELQGMQHIQKAVSKYNNEDEDSYYDRVLSPIIDVFESECNPYIFNYNELKEFLKATKSKKNIPQIASNFTKNDKALIKMLDNVKRKITEPNMKIRIRRILNKLNNCESKKNQVVYIDPWIY